MESIQLLGYLASFLVAVSLSLPNIIWLRIINFLGCVAFVTYGLSLDAIPVVVANGYVAGINSYHLFHLLKGKNKNR